MNRNFKIAVILAIAAISYLGIRILCKINDQKKIAKKTERLPGLPFTTLDNEKFAADVSISKTNQIIVNYFNPDCDHCQHMAESFLRNKDKLQEIKILMITASDSISVQKFSSHYYIDSIHSIVLLRDTEYKFSGIFGTSAVPVFFIYKNKILVKKIIGETDIENLLNE